MVRLPPSRTRAFTLVELMVVVAIIALLIGVLLPSLTAARNEGVRLKCLTNMQAIAQGFQTYAVDDENSLLIPVHPEAENGWRFDGEYEYGGGWARLNGGLANIYNGPFRPSTRILNKYLYGDVSDQAELPLFRCPGDTGVEDAPRNFDPALPVQVPIADITGTSYRVNNHIKMYTDEYFYGPYFRRSTRIPESALTVVLEEANAQVAIYNAPPYVAAGWHLKPMRYNVSFADGHGATINIQGGSEPPRDEYDNYWVYRGDGWRLDCYPDPPILDRFRPATTGSSY